MELLHAVEVNCADCGQPLIIDDITVRSQEEGEDWLRYQAEVFDDIEGRLKAKGWGRRTYEDQGPGDALCPSCLNKHSNLEPLDRFNMRQLCPKCGNNKVDTEFTDGRRLCSHGVREHLHRMCQRCGFLWAMETKDAKGIEPDKEKEHQEQMDF